MCTRGDHKISTNACQKAAYQFWSILAFSIKSRKVEGSQSAFLGQYFTIRVVMHADFRRQELCWLPSWRQGRWRSMMSGGVAR